MTKTIAICNLGGGSPATFACNFLFKQFPKDKKTVVIELPCLGIPQVSFMLDRQVDLEKEKTIDQYILDLDRGQRKQIEAYIYQPNGTMDWMLINPKTVPEHPSVSKIENNYTLIDVPYKLKMQLTGKYDFLVFILQGTMIHPMTHFALRYADVSVFYSANHTDFVGNYTNYIRFRDIMHMSAERLLFFTEEAIGVKDAQLKNYTRLEALYKQIEGLSLLHTKMLTTPYKERENRVGVIRPLDYVDAQTEQTNDLEQDAQEKLQEVIAYVRSYLQNNYLDDFVHSFTEVSARERIQYTISDFLQEQTDYTFDLPIKQVIAYIAKDITGLGVLQDALDDPTVTSIEINAPDQIIVEQKGITKHLVDVQFRDIHHLYQTINKILQPIGKPLTSNEPIIDANYRGFRVCVIADNQQFQGISSGSPLVSIRKFPPSVYSHQQCIEYGNLTQEMVDFLAFVVPCGANIIIAGGTNSGKTTQLIRLPLFVSPLERIISIEDTEEMMLASKKEYQHYVNLPSLIVKSVEDEAKSYEINDLIKAALRLNPTIIAIGEVRDAEAAQQLLIAMNTGHVGWSSIHANSAKEAATRLLQLNGNSITAASQIGSSIDVIIFQRKLTNGVRVVTEISELMGFTAGNEPKLNPIFKYNYHTKKHEQVGVIQSETLSNKIEAHEPKKELYMKWCAPQKGEKRIEQVDFAVTG